MHGMACNRRMRLMRLACALLRVCHLLGGGGGGAAPPFLSETGFNFFRFDLRLKFFFFGERFEKSSFSSKPTPLLSFFCLFELFLRIFGPFVLIAEIIAFILPDAFLSPARPIFAPFFFSGLGRAFPTCTTNSRNIWKKSVDFGIFFFSVWPSPNQSTSELKSVWAVDKRDLISSIFCSFSSKNSFMTVEKLSWCSHFTLFAPTLSLSTRLALKLFTYFITVPLASSNSGTLSVCRKLWNSVLISLKSGYFFRHCFAR
mmetsp:Transcript_8165/g.15957  ORF Transcript_8165/g.15957 Transcript_8165/m.15957 type:complete len:258 (+) Transcript_8165:79-852(+)